MPPADQHPIDVELDPLISDQPLPTTHGLPNERTVDPDKGLFDVFDSNVSATRPGLIF